jgi:hypothetical protein
MSGWIFPADPVDTDADGIPDFPEYAGRILRQLISVLLNGHRGGSVFGARNGISPSTADNVVTATDTAWTMNPLGGVIDVELAANAGPYLFVFDAVETDALTPADSAHDRIDILSVQISDPAESDGTSLPGIVPVYTPGTPSGTPSPPATPARSLRIAQIAVPRATTGSPVVTLVAPYMCAAGGVTPCRDATEFPANPYDGQWVDDRSISALCRYDATNDIWEPIRQKGSAEAYTIGTGFQTTTGTTAFNRPYSAAPVVMATLKGTNNHIISVTAVTATNFSWRVHRSDNTNASSNEAGTFGWLAMP